MATGLAVAATAGLITQGVAAQRQAEIARRTETRAKGIAAQEERRQAEQDRLLKSQESATQQRVAARLRATAGKRAGRRSLLFGSDLGTEETLG